MVYQEGKIFKGEFVESIQNGLGTLKDTNGEIFAGNFLDGEPNGLGIIVNKSSVFQGTFKDGQL